MKKIRLKAAKDLIVFEVFIILCFYSLARLFIKVEFIKLFIRRYPLKKVTGKFYWELKTSKYRLKQISEGLANY
jgi:hypothetical protein